jgi:hypothetical protein
MSRSAALTATAALLALAGCFQINTVESCQLLCTPGVACPNDMTCLPQPGLQQGLCVDSNVRMCAPLQSMDGGTDASAPAMLAHNGQSFTLPPDIRDNLVLLLWPDNLPPDLGAPVPVWHDQSGHGNDAQPVYPTAPPHVIADGVQLDPSQVGSGFEVQNSPSLDLGSGDFSVIVVAGIPAGIQTVTLFSKADGVASGSRKITIRYTPATLSTGLPQGFLDDKEIEAATVVSQPSVRVYGLRRVGDHVELRSNGGTLASDDVPAGISTTNSESAYLGTASPAGYTVDSLEAAFVVRGSTTTDNLNALESFLTTVFSMGS